MDNYKQMMDTEHREEVEALTKEWTNERKVKITVIIFFVLYFILFFFCFVLFIYSDIHI